MKLSAIATVSFIALLSLAGTASADARCLRLEGAGTYFYEVVMEGVPKREFRSTCNGLWDNLKGYLDCMVYRPNGCEEGYYNGDLYWYFTTSIVCNQDMVHSAYYGATKNQWGAITCH
ncbi:hypothetical protein ColTof4_11735 [Colletotrichum tofieldiae]|uniref:Secreted protein n=1 Tax=Colletotrichum tofieldiae TaxID=708197 RepID=A0A161VNR3_9PEZI|nr:hypothetical protein CT0861_08970 [Colletotrichum tofieldiae]GKT55850.1 hypothetical protein ColTof3_03189 [Colletotrichum tofieldiae]GKT79312.1 hypothetical protein ColTof4_11735 [Colletotrichum tofieldiae]GKT82482.1 hypothetical protein Ct61P_00332 [Colletotrichum tofieldiae]